MLDDIKASNLEKEALNAPLEERNLEIKAYNMEHPEDPLPYERMNYYTLGYRFLRVNNDPLAEIMNKGQELRLQVVPIYPDAPKTSKQDSVLQGIIKP